MESDQRRRERATPWLQRGSTAGADGVPRGRSSSRPRRRRHTDDPARGRGVDATEDSPVRFCYNRAFTLFPPPAVLNELNELEELELESQLLDAPPIPVAPLPLAPTPAMPEAPTTLPTPPAQEDADMAARRRRLLFSRLDPWTILDPIRKRFWTRRYREPVRALGRSTSAAAASPRAGDAVASSRLVRGLCVRARFVRGSVAACGRRRGLASDDPARGRHSRSQALRELEAAMAM